MNSAAEDSTRGCYDELCPFGTRSLSIWSAHEDLMLESRDDPERTNAEAIPADAHSTDTDAAFDGRRINKRLQMECTTIGRIGARVRSRRSHRLGGVINEDVTTREWAP